MAIPAVLLLQADPAKGRIFAHVATELEAALKAQRSQHVGQAVKPSQTPASDAEAAAMRLITLSGGQCHPKFHTDLWGDVVAWGSQNKAGSAAECCASCHAHNAAVARGGLEKGKNSTLCDTWVFCGDKHKCGAQYQECWLKNNKLRPPPNDLKGHSGPDVHWTSGVVYPNPDWQLNPLAKKLGLTMVTTIGNIVIKLLPELAPASVKELQRCVGIMLDQGHCMGCRIYRSEVNFLIQGVIMSPGCYVATPRHPNPPQKKIMERGLVCWAGGAGGPDWFVNLIDQPRFGDDHLCWGKISSTDMALLDSITKRPLKPKAKPDEMTFLAEEIRFNLTLSD
jgi:cyclophilin family peptidyl-prolyl cis-trans isomerase